MNEREKTLDDMWEEYGQKAFHFPPGVHMCAELEDESETFGLPEDPCSHHRLPKKDVP